MYLLDSLELFKGKNTLSLGKSSQRSGQEHLGHNVSAGHKERKNCLSFTRYAVARICSVLNGKTRRTHHLAKWQPGWILRSLCALTCPRDRGPQLWTWCAALACKLWTCVCSHHPTVPSEHLVQGVLLLQGLLHPPHPRPLLWNRDLMRSPASRSWVVHLPCTLGRLGLEFSGQCLLPFTAAAICLVF